MPKRKTIYLYEPDVVTQAELGALKEEVEKLNAENELLTQAWGNCAEERNRLRTAIKEAIKRLEYHQTVVDVYYAYEALKNALEGEKEIVK